MGFQYVWQIYLFFCRIISIFLFISPFTSPFPVPLLIYVSKYHSILQRRAFFQSKIPIKYWQTDISSPFPIASWVNHLFFIQMWSVYSRLLRIFLQLFWGHYCTKSCTVYILDFTLSQLCVRYCSVSQNCIWIT